MSSGDKPKSSKAKDEGRRRKQASADLRQRGGKNLVFGAVAAVAGALLTMWSKSQVDLGLSATQVIYWALIAGGALEIAVGIWQLYQANEVIGGRMAIPASTEARLPQASIAAGAAQAGPVELEFCPARGKHVGWLAVALLLGALFVFGLGGFGTLVGGALLLWGGYHGYQLANKTLRTPQVIRISKKEVRLPRHAFGDDAILAAADEVKHAFFLRRAVPLFHAPPVLVVDLGDETILYPRDWFPSDGDQERCAAALRANLPQ